jgi:organic radical activating enzyme
MKFNKNDIVKSCSRIESGLRLAVDGIKACTFSTGAIEAPNYWDSDSIPPNLTKAMLIDKRRSLFEMLNDDHSDILCKKCLNWEYKPYEQVRFDQLEFVNVAHFSACNLRCNYCGFTKENNFTKEKYSALEVLKIFDPIDVTFDSSVDFNAGEPTLMKDLDEHLNFFRNRRMRTRLYSNGVIFSKSVYDAVFDGTITWLIISVDAGTSETYIKTKKSNSYLNVIKNIFKYREAEFNGVGKIAVKYIFTSDTLEDKDIEGFVFAMLASGVQNIWLLYDYFLFHDAVILDEDKYIDAYAKMYLLFKEYGVIPSHFGDAAAGAVLESADRIITKTKELIDAREKSIINKVNSKKIIFHHNIKIFREEPIPNFNFNKKINHEELIKYICSSSKILIAPAGALTLKIINEIPTEYIKNIKLISDLSLSKQGSEIRGIKVVGYKDLNNDDFDHLLITNEYFSNAIVYDIGKTCDISVKKVILLNIVK